VGQQSVWQLADVSSSVDSAENNARQQYIPVASKRQLEASLRMAITRIGTTLNLRSDDGLELVIGLSTHFGWLVLQLPPKRIRQHPRPQQITAPEPCLFRGEGIVSEVLPEDLFPVEEIILIVLYFFENKAFPDSVLIEGPPYPSGKSGLSGL